VGSVTIKVSVVVPVFNPRHGIDDLIESLAAQSLSPEQFDVVLVDDGSTDGTSERLRQVCEQHRNMRTVAIPSSGWPGRPRNVGTDLAEGEYVFYADNDDYLFPEALERAYSLAARNHADIVFGKVVRKGRDGEAPWPRNIDAADPITDDLVSSRTVHKLFRRAFLVEHDIRFVEGPVRLEDHAFMARALPCAKVVSVLADYPVYQWTHWGDGSNTSSTASRSMKAEDYWQYYASSLRIFAEEAGEGDLLDAARLVAVRQGFSRVNLNRWRGWGERHRQAVFCGVGGFVDQIPRDLDARLPVLVRLRVKALRDRDRERFVALLELRAAYHFEVSVERARWDDGRLVLAVRATLTGDPELSLMQPGPDGSLLMPLPPGTATPALSEDDRVLLAGDHGTLQLTMRHRPTGVEWPLDAATESTQHSGRAARSGRGGIRLTLRAEARLDPVTGALGGQLADGVWDLLARVQFLGEHSVVPLASSGVSRPGGARFGDRVARGIITRSGKLALEVTHQTVGGAAERTMLSGLTWEEDRLQLRFAQVPPHRAAVVLRARGQFTPASFPVTGSRAELAVDHLAPGASADLYLRVDSVVGADDERLRIGSATIRHHPAYAVDVGPVGQISVRRLRPDEPPPAPRHVAVRGRPGLPHLDARSLVAGLPGPIQRAARDLWDRLPPRLRAWARRSR
jgi:hypothetical protein